MDTKVLIDALVHQTTVLIAQLSTAAGIRAPLAHIADQVFLELSREIEAQGISRKVAADMFGLAIRTYQKKVQRLTESVVSREKTLWQAMLDYLEAHGSVPRRQLLAHFGREDPLVVGSVISDLVASGLVYRTGTGDATILGVTQARDLEQARREQRRETLAPILWVMTYRAGAATRADLREQIAVDESVFEEALVDLVAEGRISVEGEGEGAVFRASTFLVPLDSEHGWEAAVLDHFQAMVRAVAAKVRRGQARSTAADVVGGATLTFDVSPTHPLREETIGLLRHVREEVNELWHRVQDYNEKHPISEEDRELVSFYFGQSWVAAEEE